MANLDDLHKDIKGIQTTCTKLSVQSAVHTTQLKHNTESLEKHHQRSTLMEQRIVPLEDQAKFQRGLIKLAIVLGAISGTVLTILRLTQLI